MSVYTDQEASPKNNNETYTTLLYDMYVPH